MKKLNALFVTLLLLLLGTSAQAQDGESPKAQSGDITIELQASSPFSGGPDFLMPSLRGRYFLSNDMAIRSTFRLDIDNVQDPDTDNNQDVSGSIIDFAITPALEYHMEGTERLDPYVGPFLNLGLSSANAEFGDTEYSGFVPGDPNDPDAEKRATGGFTVGLGGVAGADYYVVKQLYVGAEVGYGFNLMSPATQEVDGNTVASPGSKINLSDSFIGNFRVGWAF